MGPAAAWEGGATTDALLTGRILAGRYRIERRIASGGSATVYRGRHLVLGHDVAVKVLDATASAVGDDVDRFLAEARAVARLRHPNIVQVHDFGCGEGRAWMVMELLDGETLADRCDKLGRLPSSSVRRIMLQLCSALQAAHDAGVIHRDVTPANLLCIPHTSDPDLIKLVDFGIAAIRSGDEIRSLEPDGVIAGTPHYMAPERLSGESDERADVYSAGVVMYELLTGTPPFDGPTPQAILLAHADQPIEPPSRRTANCCLRAIDRVVMRAMAKSPSQRHGSMRELSAAIRQAWQPSQATVFFDGRIRPRKTAPPALRPDPMGPKPASVIVSDLETASAAPSARPRGVGRRALLTLAAGVTLALGSSPLIGSSGAAASVVSNLASAATTLGLTRQ